MTGSLQTADALVIGGGFYGAAIAIHLVKHQGLERVVLLERESALMQRASYNNQARVHNGYHYPRSFTTAYRSRINLPRFVRDWPDVVKRDFTKLYAIARRNSKVTARQFQRFCQDIGASISPAESNLSQLFDHHLIEAVFRVEEYAFDTTRLAAWAAEELREHRVELMFDTRATRVSQAGDRLQLDVMQGTEPRSLTCRYLFNCTYANLNQFEGDFGNLRLGLKHEITEMALVEMPQALADIGITVMDGPFFSMMPFPARGLHTLSHVRYTPHLHWFDEKGVDPAERLRHYPRDSRFDRMQRDVARYLPAIRDARYRDSLFEVKTLLVKNEADDGRPILFEQHPTLPGCYSVLGGKIDNIYDILEKLDQQVFRTASR